MKYLLLVFFCTSLILKPLSQNNPNFIFILADDQGWNGTSVMMDPNNPESKSDYHETPNLERLALAGMRFSRAYAPAPKCSPSRMSIITGQTTAENHFTNTSSMSASGKTLIEPSSNTSITSDELTLPEYINALSSVDYLSAHFGKWHLGSDLPTSHGFDQSDGANSNNTGSSGVSINDDPKQIFSLTQKGIDFITEAKAANKPFYLQLSHYAVHTDIESTSESFSKYDAKNKGSKHENVSYAAMTEDLDSGVGLILDFLEEEQLIDNTYIIYFSDNGGQLNVTSNSPLKLGKTMIFEGGIRVPLIISGPGITGNSHSDVAVIGYDFYPTIIDLIGEDLGNLPDDLDGISFKGILNGSATELTREQPLIFHSPHYENNANKTPRSTIIDGPNKLIVEYETGARLHYNLDSDISESSDSYSSDDETSNNLVLKLRDYLKGVNAQMPTYSLTDSDSDSDGIPDEWEFINLLGTLFGADDDPDNDGISNIIEYNNDTDPLTTNDMIPETLNLKVQNKPISIYPNPTKGLIHFSNLDLSNNDLLFSLFSLNGELILKESITAKQPSILLPDNLVGIYFYRINSENEELARGKLLSK